jgi:outer membrane immunogenic protein
MKKILLSAASLLALAAPAAAADMVARPIAKAPPAYVAPTPVSNWTGFYLGGHVGGAWAGESFTDNGRFMAGVQGGADLQFAPNWVAGVEANYSWLGNRTDSYGFPGAGVVTRDNNGIGSVTGRLGFTWGGPLLLYAKGGFAFKDSNDVGVFVGGAAVPFALDSTRSTGYTVGGGLEYMFAPNWSAKAEYQYYDFGRKTFTLAPVGLAGTSFRDDDHTVKVGLNYRFGNWSAPPVTARY